jgi:hypothetical protein
MQSRNRSRIVNDSFVTSSRFIVCRSQSVTTASSSVDAGDVRQSIAFWSNAAVRHFTENSRRARRCAEKPVKIRVIPIGYGGQNHFSTSAISGRNFRRIRVRISARHFSNRPADCSIKPQIFQMLEITGNPINHS